MKHRLWLLLAICALNLTSPMAMPLHAGQAALDNHGRVSCDAEGRIAASQRQALQTALPGELDVGATITIPAVCPAERYFPTGVLVTPGASYQISAQGKWQDGWIKVGAGGWNGLFLEAWNRLAWKPFFLLGGAIGASERQLFPIGAGRTWKAPISLAEKNNRQLYLFANDWPGKYGNNRAVADSAGGPLRVSIRRLD